MRGGYKCFGRVVSGSGGVGSGRVDEEVGEGVGWYRGGWGVGYRFGKFTFFFRGVV